MLPEIYTISYTITDYSETNLAVAVDHKKLHFVLPLDLLPLLKFENPFLVEI